MSATSTKGICQLFRQTIFNDWLRSSMWGSVGAEPVEYDDAEARGSRKEEVEWLADLAFLYRVAFPDLRFDIEGQVTEEDRVVTCLRLRGTQRERLLGVEPNGRTLDVNALRIDRLADGKVAESWFRLDSLALLRQLGALPEVPSVPRPVSRPRREGGPRASSPMPEMAVWAEGPVVREAAVAS
jgi:predicted ester cyclase